MSGWGAGVGWESKSDDPVGVLFYQHAPTVYGHRPETVAQDVIVIVAFGLLLNLLAMWLVGIKD